MFIVADQSLIKVQGHDLLVDLRAWPASSPTTSNFLRDPQLQTQYGASPIPAFDETGKLISPDLYPSMLKGAIVRFAVTLSHAYDRENNRDGFYANLQSVHILKRQLGLSHTASKEDLCAGILKAGYIYHVVDRDNLSDM